jgi:hypothetical protein
MTEHEKLLEKIKKCLALSSSSNPHEAETALRQARKLMDAHDITVQDVQAAEVEECHARAGSAVYPANWETTLATKVGDIFGCKVLFSEAVPTGWGEKGQWRFIGCGADPDVAKYAFDVLVRQARQARKAHIHDKLKRCRPAIKTRRADLFSEGWVRSATGVIAAFCGTQQRRVAIDAYMSRNYPTLGALKSRDRNADRRLREHECNDYGAGCRAGRDAQLNRGVGSAADGRVALQ